MQTKMVQNVYKRLPLFLTLIITLTISLKYVSADERPLGCAFRPKNASLFCLIPQTSIGNRTKNNLLASTIIISQLEKESTKYLSLECSQETKTSKRNSWKDSRAIPLNDKDNDSMDSDDDDDDDDFDDDKSRDLWMNLKQVSVYGCPLHQAAVKNENQIPTPMLRGDDPKKDDFFSDFLITTIGGQMEVTRLESLDVVMSGLNRPLTSRTRTFCELSERIARLNVSSNYYNSLADIFGSAFGASDKCPFAKLSTLNAAGNQIRTIRSNDFAFAPNLETIDMSLNSLERIESGAFKPLVSLKTIHLSDNHLSLLSPAPWSNLSQLRELYLQGNSIERLPEFVGLSHLVVLNLSRNSIATIDDNAFADLSELVALDLSHNRIVKLGDDLFAGLKSLQILTLAHNRLQTVSAATFSPLVSLQVLILSQNVIDHVDQFAFSELAELRTLSLNRNRMKSLHRDVFEKCRSLRDLSLAANLFRHFPQALKPVGGTLQTLDFGENLLQHLHPTALSGLGQLYGLRLANNKLRNLTENVFEGVENLGMLNLASNLLQNISKKAFSALKDLKALRLDDNQLEDINGLLMSQHHLQWLNVSHNQLQWFDYAFIPKSVLWLSLRANLIEELANYYEMRTGFQLVHLDVGQNRLIRLDRHALQSGIQEIYADRNLISELAANTFSDLANLTKINLTGNRLDKFPLNALALQLGGGSAEIFLSGNPLQCDCEMEWLQRIVKLVNSSPREFPKIGDWEEVTCSLNNRHVASGPKTTSPNSTAPLLTMPVAQVQPSEFICQYQTHCYALCMCCDFFACDCRMKCSDGCDCYHDTTWSANIIHCGRRNHADIPKFIPMDATSIYLDGNSFGSLTGDEFIGRKHLTSLFLNSSGIIGVSNKTFKGLTELLVLHLDHNLIGNFTGGEFEELSALRELHLNDNRLTWIAEDTFSPLINLRMLKLDNNRITMFPVWRALRSLPQLQHLALAGNPWSCQCDFVQKLQLSVGESRPEIVPDFSQLQCVSGSLTSDIGKFNLSCADVLAVSFRSGDTILGDIMPILAVVAASLVIVVSLIILAIAIRKPFSMWLHKRYGVRLNKSHPNGTTPGGERFSYDCLIHSSPVDEEFIRQTIVTRLEAAKRLPYRTFLTRQGSRNEDLRSLIHSSASVIIVASETFVQHTKSQTEVSAIYETCLTSDNKPLLVIAMDAITAKTVRKNLPKLKVSNVLVWGTSDFWQTLMFKLPDPVASDSSANDDKVPDSMKFDDEMWTYLRGVKVESALNTSDPVVLSDATKETLAALQNSFSGPSGDSSLSTQSTDNSGGSLSHGKKRSATLNHARHSSRGKSDFQANESSGLSSTTMMGRRARDQWEAGPRWQTTKKSDGARVFENPLDKLHNLDGGSQLTSDSDYMSVNDSLLRHEQRRNHPGNNNEPIYHTLEDDDDNVSETKINPAGVTKTKEQTVYINADLEVVYPPIPPITNRRGFISDDDDDAEFEHLLRAGSVMRNGTTFDSNLGDTDCDEYENDIEDESDLFQHHNGYVPSPAPGSYPRHWMTPSGGNKPSSTNHASSTTSFSPRLTQPRKANPLKQAPKQYVQQTQLRRGSQQQQFDGYLI